MAFKYRPGIVHLEDNKGNSVNIMGLLSDSNSSSSCNCDSISNPYIKSTCINNVLLENKISSNSNSKLWKEVLK